MQATSRIHLFDRMRAIGPWYIGLVRQFTIELANVFFFFVIILTLRIGSIINL